MCPSTTCSSAPAAAHSARVMAGAPAGIAIRLGSPARAAYAAQAAPAFPLVGMATPGHAEFRGPGHPDRRAAGLERAGGQQALVLHEQPGHAERAAQPGQRQQRGHALTQADHLARAADRQQLVIPPQVRRPGGDRAG